MLPSLQYRRLGLCTAGNVCQVFSMSVVLVLEQRRCRVVAQWVLEKRGFMNIDPLPALFGNSPEEGRCLESGRIHRHGCNRQRSALTATSPHWPNRTGMYFRALRVGHRSKQYIFEWIHTRLVQTPKSQCLYCLWWRRYGPSSIRPFHKHGTTDLETQ